MLKEWRGLSARQQARAILVAVVAVLGALVLYRVRGAIAPFVLGLLLAYVLVPAVNWLERHMPARLRRGKIARAIAIVVVYVVGLGVLAGFFAYLVPVMIRQVEQLIARRQAIYDAVRAQLSYFSNWYQTNVPIGLRTLIETQLRAASGNAIAGLQRGLLGGLSAVRTVVSVIIGFVVVPFWLFLVLYDSDRLGRDAIAAIPEGLRPDVLSIASIVDGVLGAYLRGQLLVAATTGALSIIALTIVGVSFPVFLGVMVGVLDLIPTLGPIIGLIPVLIIAGLDRPSKALWALVALVAIEQFEVNVIAPRLVGQSVRIRSALIIVLLVIGNELWGIVGLLIIVPLAAVLRDIVRYLYARTSPQGTSPEQARELVRASRHHEPAPPASTSQGG